MNPEQEKVRSLLVDTITLLCRNGLTFASDVKVQGLLAITIDSKEFFVVQIDETLAENLDDNPIDCGEPDQLDQLSQTLPSMRKHEVQNNQSRLPGRKRVRRMVTDEMNDSKSFCPQSSQQDLLADNYQDRFVDRLSSVSAQVKVEDDDLLLVDSSGNSVVSQSYDYGNSGGDLRPNRKDFCGSLTVTGATAGPSRSGQVRSRQGRKRTGQWNSFEGVEWTGQGDAVSSLAINYGLDETEEKHQPEPQIQDMTTTFHPVQLTDADWSSIDDDAHHWDAQNNSSSRDQMTTGGGDSATTTNPLLAFDHPQLMMISSKRSSSSTIFKPFACRFPGCQKRFCHETHTRRHERETHNYYRQRQKQHLQQHLHLQPSSILNSVCANVFGASSSSSDQLNGSTRHRHHHHPHQQQQPTTEPVASGATDLASSSSLLHVFSDSSDQQML